MDDVPPQPPRPEAAGLPKDELDQVRELLFGREQVQLSRLQERLENPELHARDVSRVLPEAVRLSTADGDHLARSLTPLVESALHESVRRRPSIITNAIFPVIGPAIRRALAEAIGRLVQSVNQALEHSLSWRGLTWRWEALRTGRSYAEIVLYRTLVYRVEQLFLVQRPTGLLLHHVTRPEVPADNRDVVSGLLTAIQEFAAESFRVGPGESLHSFQVGSLTVWVETGPHASLAAVIRGHAPIALRETLQRTVERLHLAYPTSLAAASGPDELPAGVDPLLSECLLDEFGHDAAAAGRPWKAWVFAAVMLALIGTWVVLGIREERRWQGYLDRLAAEDGLVVVSSGKRGGTYRLTGWRDPLAPDPSGFLAQFQLSTNDLVARWEAYQSLSPSLVIRRARQFLRVPDGVNLQLEDGVLRAEGVAAKEWVDAARRRAESLAGVQDFDASRVFDEGRAQLSAALRKVEATILYFGETTRLLPNQESVVAQLVADLRALGQAAGRVGRRPNVAVLGHTDRTGTAEYNLRLSRQRAEEARRLLEAQGLPSAWFEVKGLGTSQPLRTGLAGAEETRNRRVTLRVTLDPVDNGAPPP